MLEIYIYNIQIKIWINKLTLVNIKKGLPKILQRQYKKLKNFFNLKKLTVKTWQALHTFQRAEPFNKPCTWINKAPFAYFRYPQYIYISCGSKNAENEKKACCIMCMDTASYARLFVELLTYKYIIKRN